MRLLQWLKMLSPTPPNQKRISDVVFRAGLVAWAALGMILLAVIVTAILYLVRDIFPPLVLALMVIFLLNPLVKALEKAGIRRSFGTIGIYLVFAAVVVVLFSWLLPILGEQGKELGKQLPQLQRSTADGVQKFASRIGVPVSDAAVQDFFSRLGEGFSSRGSGRSLGGLQQIRTITAGALHVVVIFVLAPIFALYILIDLPRLQKSFTSYLPPRFKDEWLMLFERCGQAVGGFFRGQLLVAAIVGVMSAVFFFFLDLPFWLAIGLLAGFFNIIPLVGPFVGGGIAVLVGAVTGGADLAIKAAVAMAIVQQIDNHFISPKVMGRAVRLHPVTVMVALLAGATIAGLWGMLISVPFTAIVKIVGLHFYETRVLQLPDLPPETAEESDEGMVERVIEVEEAMAPREPMAPERSQEVSESEVSLETGEESVPTATGPRGRAARRGTAAG